MLHVIQAARLGVIRRESNYSAERERAAWRVVDRYRLHGHADAIYRALEDGATEADFDEAARTKTTIAEVKAARAELLDDGAAVDCGASESEAAK